MTQNQVGTNTTSSRPFIAPGDVIYFRGTDDRLLKVNSDGSGFTAIGTNTTSSSPFVLSDPVGGQWVYFRGTDNRLLKVRGDSDGSGLVQIGTNTTNSTPFVTFDSNTGEVWVYFQGTDQHSRLLKVRSDGTGFTQIGSNQTGSSPFVLSDPVGGEWVYFQGTDKKLWKVRPDSAGSELTQIGTNHTNSTPFVTVDGSTGDVWIYFQGTDNKLWKVRNDAAGTGLSHIGGNFTKSSPYVTEDGWVYFQGTDVHTNPNSPAENYLWRVFNDGTQQSKLGLTSSTPAVGAMQIADAQVSRWVYFQEEFDNKLMRYLQPESPLAIGTMRPKFYVLTVLYAPPGTNGGSSESLVDYSSGSATGTKTTTSNSFKEGLDVGFGAVIGPSLEFSMSDTTTDSSSIQIQKAETFDIKIPGPAADGIDHHHDVFVLLLNPLLTVATFPGNTVQVAMGVDGPTMNIQYVYAGWLQDVATMAPGVKQQLDAAGLDASDYAQILSTNPFQSGSSTIDTNRYQAVSESFAYEPPYSAKDEPWMETYTVQNTTTATSDQKAEVSYSVGISSGLLDSFLKISGSLQWTNTTETETTDASTESASVTVGGPSFGYSGPTDVLVYWDSVFHSFMFAFPSGTARASAGSSRNRRGRTKASHG